MKAYTNRNWQGGNDEGYSIRGLPARFSLKDCHWQSFRRSKPSNTSPKGPLGPSGHPSWRTCLATITSNLRLKLERRKESFRAEENRRQSGKMSLLIFSGLTPVFAVRFAHSTPAKLAARKRWTALSKLLREAACCRSHAASAAAGSRGFERPENLPLGWFSAKSGPAGPG